MRFSSSQQGVCEKESRVAEDDLELTLGAVAEQTNGRA